MQRPAFPERLGRGKLIQREFALNNAVSGDLVVEEESVTVGAEDKGHLKHPGITKCLLHAISEGVAVLLGLNDGNGDIGFVEEHVVNTLVLSAGVQLATEQIILHQVTAIKIIYVVLVIIDSNELPLHTYTGMAINFTLITKVFHGIDD